MTFLYVKDGCLGCAKAREYLAVKGEEYKEVEVDNPVVRVGIQTLLRKDRTLVPLLVRENGGIAELFAPARGPDGTFTFMKVI